MTKRNRKRARWANTGHYKTPLGEAKRIASFADYLRALNTGHQQDLVEQLTKDGRDLEGVIAYRLFLQGAYDPVKLENVIRELTKDGEPFTICQIRVSGSENQEDGASFPQQERDNVLMALNTGARRLLVVCEIYSAAAGSQRGAFTRLVRCVRDKQVETWVASQLDRITRNPSDAVAFVEAIQDSNTELRSATHTGPVNPYEALILMLQFIMAAFHIIAIRSGNARGWRKRLDEGRWPNTGQPLPGMEIDEAGRPYWAPRAAKALPVLCELLDPAGSNLPSVSEAAARLEGLQSEWWKTKTDDRAPSEARLKRLIGSTALVDGKQTFEFNGESREVHFEHLGGIVEQDRFERVGKQVLYNEARERGPRGSWWARLLRELLELGHPMSVLIDESERTLRWAPDGTIEVVCPKCNGNSTLRESDPHFEDLTLVDGRVRRNVRVPTFRCDGCNSTTRPIGLPALRLLLAGCRRLACVKCGSHDAEVALKLPSPLRVVSEVVAVRCRACGQRFWFDPDTVPGAERYRYFARQLPAPRRPQFRSGVDLDAFQPDEGTA